jgi:hypothetical protein
VKSDFQSANLSKKVCFSVICCSSRGSLLVSWSWMFGISLPSKLCCSRVSDSATSHLDAKKYHVTQRSVESPRSIIVFRISVLFCDIHSHNFSFRTQRRKETGLQTLLASLLRLPIDWFPSTAVQHMLSFWIS